MIASELENEVHLSKNDWKNLIGGGLLCIPLSLWTARQGWSIIGSTLGPENLPAELFGFFLTLLLLGFGYFQLRKTPNSWRRAFIIGAPCALLLLWASINTEFSRPSYDYKSYENAAKHAMLGRPIYGKPGKEDFGYIYPPLLAMSLSGIRNGIVEVGGRLGFSTVPWPDTFFVHQVLMMFCLMWCYLLLFRTLRKLGCSQVQSTAIVTAFLGLNSLIIRNYSYNQINVPILCFSLFALLYATEKPALAGFAGAVGVHLKLYPITVLIELVRGRKFKAVFWMVFGILAILALETKWFRDWSDWEGFVRVLSIFPSSGKYRDNSILRVMNSIGTWFHPFLTIAPVLSKAIGLGAFVAVVQRLRIRSKLFEEVAGVPSTLGHLMPTQAWITFANAADIIAVSLLLGPLTWEHHYILALPLALVVLITRSSASVGLSLLCFALLFSPPIFDVYPLSFHRLAGLLLAFWITRPATAKLALNESRTSKIAGFSAK